MEAVAHDGGLINRYNRTVFWNPPGNIDSPVCHPAVPRFDRFTGRPTWWQTTGTLNQYLLEPYAASSVDHCEHGELTHEGDCECVLESLVPVRFRSSSQSLPNLTTSSTLQATLSTQKLVSIYEELGTWAEVETLEITEDFIMVAPHGLRQNIQATRLRPQTKFRTDGHSSWSKWLPMEVNDPFSRLWIDQNPLPDTSIPTTGLDPPAYYLHVPWPIGKVPLVDEWGFLIPREVWTACGNALEVRREGAMKCRVEECELGFVCEDYSGIESTGDSHELWGLNTIADNINTSFRGEETSPSLLYASPVDLNKNTIEIEQLMRVSRRIKETIVPVLVEMRTQIQRIVQDTFSGTIDDVVLYHPGSTRGLESSGRDRIALNSLDRTRTAVRKIGAGGGLGNGRRQRSRGETGCVRGDVVVSTESLLVTDRQCGVLGGVYDYLAQACRCPPHITGIQCMTIHIQETVVVVTNKDPGCGATPPPYAFLSPEWNASGHFVYCKLHCKCGTIVDPINNTRCIISPCAQLGKSSKEGCIHSPLDQKFHWFQQNGESISTQVEKQVEKQVSTTSMMSSPMRAWVRRKLVGTPSERSRYLEKFISSSVATLWDRGHGVYFQTSTGNWLSHTHLHPPLDTASAQNIHHLRLEFREQHTTRVALAKGGGGVPTSGAITVQADPNSFYHSDLTKEEDTALLEVLRLAVANGRCRQNRHSSVTSLAYVLDMHEPAVEMQAAFEVLSDMHTNLLNWTGWVNVDPLSTGWSHIPPPRPTADLTTFSATAYNKSMDRGVLVFPWEHLSSEEQENERILHLKSATTRLVNHVTMTGGRERNSDTTSINLWAQLQHHRTMVVLSRIERVEKAFHSLVHPPHVGPKIPPGTSVGRGYARVQNDDGREWTEYSIRQLVDQLLPWEITSSVWLREFMQELLPIPRGGTIAHILVTVSSTGDWLVLCSNKLQGVDLVESVVIPRSMTGSSASILHVLRMYGTRVLLWPSTKQWPQNFSEVEMQRCIASVHSEVGGSFEEMVLRTEIRCYQHSI